MCRSAGERLYSCDVGITEAFQFRQLDDPNTHGFAFAASLLPRSASSSVKYSPASLRNALDLRMPCGPSRIR